MTDFACGASVMNAMMRKDLMLNTLVESKKVLGNSADTSRRICLLSVKTDDAMETCTVLDNVKLLGIVPVSILASEHQNLPQAVLPQRTRAACCYIWYPFCFFLRQTPASCTRYLLP